MEFDDCDELDFVFVFLVVSIIFVVLDDVKNFFFR